MVLGFVLILVGIIFQNWFTVASISSGDLSFFFNEFIISYANLPFMWEAFRNLGFGGESFIHQGVYIYNLPMGILGNYVSYGVIERLLWFYPILIIGFLSPIFLGKVLHLFPSRYALLTSLIYMLNTYIFMILGGGQLTVVFAYITIPLVLGTFLSLFQNFRIYTVLLFSITFSLLVTADFRFVYIFLVMIGIYTVLTIAVATSVHAVISLIKKYIVILIISLLVVFGTQAYWLFPFLTHFNNPVSSAGAAYTSTGAVQYFSFSQFEQSISLLHPYWPENIFGKVGFMKPEFLLLPILAYGALFFIKKNKSENLNSKQIQNKIAIQQYTNRAILFFTFLGLLGAFLGKGSNEPFGGVYLWLFDHVPGFIMFRDPTKWYTLVAISYSVLIPFSISHIYSWLASQPKFQISNFKFQIKSKNKISNQNVFLVIVLGYLLFLIHPAILGQLGGTFKTITVPKEYIDYKNFLLSQKEYFRVLWVPTTPRFAFYSDTHPAIPGNYFFDSYDPYSVVNKIQQPWVEPFLKQASVKYIAVAYDTQKEIYLADREYSEEQYQQTVSRMRKIPWLAEVKQFGKIILFAVDNSYDHFWTPSHNLKLAYTYVNPTEYKVEVKNGTIGDTIVFAESFDSGWSMPNTKHERLELTRTLSFNKFVLQKAGDYTVSVVYTPQSLVPVSLGISLITLIGTIGLLIFLKRK